MDKRGAVVEAEKPLNSQLRIMTLSEGSPYETLHDYVAAAVSCSAPSFITRCRTKEKKIGNGY